MKIQQSMKTLLVSSALALSGLVPAAHAQVPGVPQTDFVGETNLQAQTQFLSFIGSFIGEGPEISAAYYKAINPSGSKQQVTGWLVRAGFIGKETDWNASGPQIIACDLPPGNGCDVPAHNPDGSLVYGPNIINTNSHAIVLNAADLGFVRNQFIRCVDPANPRNLNPCAANNPIIYTYLENYPVAGAFSSGFESTSGFVTQDEAKAAIMSALNRPGGPTGKCLTGTAPGGGKCAVGSNLQRIADVMFEWAPPENQPTSSTRFGQLYAYLVDQKDVRSETLKYPDDALNDLNLRKDFNVFKPSFPPINTKTGARITLTTNDYFAPELDGRGAKQHPTVCFVCHGGKPTNLTKAGLYPRGGNVDGFRFLPLDLANLNFSSQSGGEQPATNGSKAFTDRDHQQLQIREYNRAVLLTVDQSVQRDGQGVSRQAHLAEVINGWYGGPGLPGTTQKSDFVPAGWGSNPATDLGKLYTHTVGPSCRSCHFNRELSLDFGTAANFDQESDILQLALLPQCNANKPDHSADFMPLAHLTYLRYWQTQSGPQTLDFGSVIADHEPDRLARHFGFTSGVSSYCATNP